MSDVTPNSPFRELGNTNRDAFRAHLARSLEGVSPMAAEAEAIYDVLAPLGLTRLGAAMAWIERANDTDPDGLRYYGRDRHNAWAIKSAGSFKRYGSYTEAAVDWADRILDDHGPYAAATTLAELIAIYAPSSDGNDPTRYGQLVSKVINERLPHVADADDDDEPADDPWRPYPYPPMRRLIVRKAYDGAGFTRCRARGPRMAGSCNHITDGIPGGDQLQWYHDFFSVGGERATDALVDTVIARDGEIGLLNDWRDPNWGGTRAGWANGGADGLEGDGVAIYRRYPGNEINEVFVSKEHVTVTGKALTTDQIDASIELSTAVAQAARCPWDSYPYHPGLGGVNIEPMHFWFATKSCPAQPFIREAYPKLIKGVKAKLEAWQGGEPSEPEPTEPEFFTRYGMTQEQLEWFFGVMTRINDDGSTDELPFNPTGPLSLLWMGRCEREGIFPEAQTMRSFDSKLADGREWFATWDGGWTAWLPIDNQRAGWQWIDPLTTTAPAPTRRGVGV